MIVTEENSLLARYIAGQFGPSSQGMFSAPLRPAGDPAAMPTHYISSGLVAREFADMLASPAALIAGAATKGVAVDQEIAERLLGASDITTDLPAAALSRRGLAPFQAVQEEPLTDSDGDLTVDNDLEPLMEDSP